MPVHSVVEYVAKRVTEAWRWRRDVIRYRAHNLRLELSLSASYRREYPALVKAREAWLATARDTQEPLVSINIATYNRGQLLVERTLPSVFAQTYQNFEVVFVGDGCTDDTEQLIAKLDDPRVRFLNLPQRGAYPSKPYYMWLVAGAYPGNKCLELSRGQWITHLDDDDVYAPTFLEHALNLAEESDAELVYGKCLVETEPGVWGGLGSAPFQTGHVPVKWNTVPHSSVMHRDYLRLFRYSAECWRIDLAGDWHRWLRMGRAGVRSAFLDEVVYRMPLRPGEHQTTASRVS